MEGRDGLKENDIHLVLCSKSIKLICRVHDYLIVFGWKLGSAFVIMRFADYARQELEQRHHIYSLNIC